MVAAYSRRRAVYLFAASSVVALLAVAVVALAVEPQGGRVASVPWTALLTLSTGLVVVAAAGALAVPDVEAAQAKLIVESMPGHAWSADPQGHFTYVSPSTIRFLGAPKESLGPEEGSDEFGWRRVVHPDDYERIVARWRHCLATGERYDTEHRIRRADGVYIWFRNSGLPLRDRHGRITGWYGTTIEIEEQKKAEAALVERERELRQLIDSVPAMIWTATPDGHPSSVNRRFNEVTGCSLADITKEDGSLSVRFIHPEHRAETIAVAAKAFSTGEPYNMRYLQSRADGSHRWTETRAEPFRDESGTIRHWYGVSVDIHDLIMAQERLQERERFLWHLVETLPAMVDCASPDGEPVYRSQQLRTFLGYELEQLDGTGKSRLAATLDSGVHPDDLNMVKERYAHSLVTGEPYACRHRLRRFDGEFHWVETRAAPMRDAAGEIVQWNVICLDIQGEVEARERLRMAQDSLARASQAAGMAELSASIAHEVNQPLAAIVANAQACQRWLLGEPPNVDRAKVTAERIARDANSAADVVSRIRALFRQTPGERGAEDVNRLVSEVTRLMAEEAGAKDVRVRLELEPGLPCAPLDRVQIQQVVMNLVRNGMEAMADTPRTRVLKIHTGRQGPDDLRVEIADAGPGFVHADRAFEPFFTTKPSGMGMGLAICRSIVEAHGGRLSVGNAEDGGAVVAFTLPLAAGEAA